VLSARRTRGKVAMDLGRLALSRSEACSAERVCRSRGRTAISFSVIRVIHFTLCHLLAALWWRVFAHRGNFVIYLEPSIKPPRWSTEWNFGLIAMLVLGSLAIAAALLMPELTP
jgi:hypothetical protein